MTAPIKPCPCCNRTFDSLPGNGRLQVEYQIYYFECPDCRSTCTYRPDPEKTKQLIRADIQKYKEEKNGQI